MKKSLLTLAIIVFTFGFSFAQEVATVSFSDAMKTNLKSYNAACNNAFEKRDLAEGQRLFEDFVDTKLVGTQFDDFTIKSLRSKDVQLSKINKPVYMVTYATWCVINKGEITALNKIANELNNVQFIVLFWDKEANVKKVANQFDSAIKVCYADETTNNVSRIVATLKHTLGFPTTYFLDENKNVVSIKRVSSEYKPKNTMDQAVTFSYENLKRDINSSILNKRKPNSTLVAN